MYKVRMKISIFQGWPRKIPGSYTPVAGFLICQYTVQYTSCILCETGGILEGLWKVCIRNFTVASGFLVCQVICQYTVRILEESRGVLKVVRMECVLISYILWTMDLVFAAVKFVFGICSGRVCGYSNLSLKLIPKQTLFTCVAFCCLFNICK